MKDVAELAGVSVTTVSHVLNKTRYVDRSLVRRVENAFKSLGYQPNALARGLRRRETRMLGMVVPDNSNPYFAELARGIEARVLSLIITSSSAIPTETGLRNAPICRCWQRSGSTELFS